MRKYGYKRPSTTLYVRKRRPVRTKKPSFFFKFLSRFLLVAVLAVGLFFGARYVWRVFSQAQFTNWHAKTVVVSGISGAREQEIQKTASAFIGKPFSMTQAEQLERQFAKAYPMLAGFSVSRGLITGKLKISARPRKAVAQFVLPDHSFKYLDSSSTVYEDPQGPQNLLQIELSGEVPDKLPSSFVEWKEDLLKLKKVLPFEALQVTMPATTVTMRLTDQSLISFGSAERLKEKAARAGQILDSARQNYDAPFVMNFAYFDQGKVFLTHSSH